jgi:uncharacterized membrane protein (UPF0182 family)
MPDRGEGMPAWRARAAVRRRLRRLRALLVALAALAVLAMGFVLFAGFWTNWLWYRSLHYSSVFATTLRVRLALFAVFGLLMALTVGLNGYLAFRLRPPLAAMSTEQRSLDRYRMGLAPFKGWALASVCGLVGLIAGASASAQWRTWLEWRNGVPFGVKDPQFGKDVGFYTFDLPWYRYLLSFGFAAVVLSLLAALLVHYLYGGVRLTAPGTRVSGCAVAHLSALATVFLTLKAVAYWLDRYSLAVRSGGLGSGAAAATGSASGGSGATASGGSGWTGLDYTDVHAFLPAKTALCAIAVICALLFAGAVWRRDWSLPLVGLGLLGLSAVVIGGVYPALVDRFQVRPHLTAKEEPYLQRNIDATRAAYDLTSAKVTPYGPAGAGAAGTAGGSSGGTVATGAAASRARVRADAESAAAIRLLDPDVVAPAYQSLQSEGGPYSLSKLSVDRYPAAPGGAEQDTVVGVRELDEQRVPGRGWISDHFTWTHGYGVVAAKGTTTTAAGAPAFTESDLPATGSLGNFQQRVYYGEQTRDYAIVGDSATKEVDYTADGRRTTTTYRGGGGVSLAAPLTRAAYAVAFDEPKILFSKAIGKDSRILYDRTPEERVAAVAPWLTVGTGSAYPAVVGGRLEWIVDAYTTSDDYPYATRTLLDSATTGATGAAADTGLAAGTGTGGGAEAPANEVNYIRNSVKATVDAYTGKVTLYQWDTTDPLLKTWMKAFPGTVKPHSAIGSGLLSHLRYPEALFDVQRDMLTRYHVTDAAAFGTAASTWQVPDDPAARGDQPLEPTYQSVTLPGSSGQSYALTTTLTPVDGTGLGAYLAVGSDATSPEYGHIQLLTPAAGAAAQGPSQVQDAFTSDHAIASTLRTLGAGRATVRYGSLLAVPLDGGLLWVEPVYVTGAGADYPELRGVLASYGGRTAMGTTLDAALDGALGAKAGTRSAAVPSSASGSAAASGSASASAGTVPGGPNAPSAAGGTAGGSASGASGGGALRRALSAASRASADERGAHRRHDWAAEARAQRRLAAALKAAKAAERS